MCTKTSVHQDLCPPLWMHFFRSNCLGGQFVALKMPRGTGFGAQTAPGAVFFAQIAPGLPGGVPGPLRVSRALIYRACAQNQASGELEAVPAGPGGKDISAPAEEIHNENPSLVALGKNRCRKVQKPKEINKYLSPLLPRYR